MLVVDASFAIRAALAHDGFDCLQKREAIAPALLWSESLSVLHEMQWRNAISPQLAETARRRLEAAPITQRRSARLRQRAWEIAARLGWAKTYDAEYVALAQVSNCPLLTIDARLARTAWREVEILTPDGL